MTRFITRAAAIAALVVILFLVGCKDDELNNSNVFFRDGNLKVTVLHPEQGAGPGFLVKSYHFVVNEPDGSRDYLETTENNGVATFQTLEPGLNIVSCTVPGDPEYYAIDTVDVPLTDTAKLTLELQAQ